MLPSAEAPSASQLQMMYGANHSGAKEMCTLHFLAVLVCPSSAAARIKEKVAASREVPG